MYIYYGFMNRKLHQNITNYIYSYYVTTSKDSSYGTKLTNWPVNGTNFNNDYPEIGILESMFHSLTILIHRYIQ